MAKNDYIEIMEKNHMEIPWHDYTENDSEVLIQQAGLIEKASVVGRVGLIMLSCGTGAWRVRTSMNRLSKELGVTCTVDVGLMSIEFNCFDGKECVSQSLSIANTGVNTAKLYRMEQFVDSFPSREAHLTGEEIHKRPDISVLCCLLFRDFRLSQVELTWQNWICDPVWSGLPIRSLLFWLRQCLHGSWRFC